MRCLTGTAASSGEGCRLTSKRGEPTQRTDRANVTHVCGVRYTEPKLIPNTPERVAHCPVADSAHRVRMRGIDLPKDRDTPGRDTPSRAPCDQPSGWPTDPCDTGSSPAHGPEGPSAIRRASSSCRRRRYCARLGDRAGPVGRDAAADLAGRPPRGAATRPARADLRTTRTLTWAELDAGSTRARAGLRRARRSPPTAAPGPRRDRAAQQPDFAVALLRRAARRAGRRAGQPRLHRAASCGTCWPTPAPSVLIADRAVRSTGRRRPAPTCPRCPP